MDLITKYSDLQQLLADDPPTFIQKLKRAQLLPESLRCSVRSCRRLCSFRRRTGVPLGYNFYCVRCKKQYTLTTGTFFEKVRFPIRDVLYIMWHWACGARVGTMADSLDVPKKIVIQMVRYLRDICSWKLLQVPELFALGGIGHCVQIEETLLTKRKCPVGPNERSTWVLGMYDVNTKRGYIHVIPDRTDATLTDIIKQHVLPGTEIWTGCGRGYSGLSTLDGVSPYLHRTVDHTRNFRDPVTGVCTNHVKGYWSRLKLFLRQLGVMSSPFIDEYVDMFMWFERFGPQAKDRMRNLVLHIAEKYPV